ncbi:sensor domain-containing diguanylate cyclase [Paenibacillus xanthanilyticus]|uniref:Diguanylate cyclase domain-containing protein n=1 Tax=Paenibacillus xanthanilyticus TaxID=1783531 RepID=A0ABV8K5B6_9BACL
MNEISLDFLTILLPSYVYFYMAITLYVRNRKSPHNRVASLLMLSLLSYFMGEYIKSTLYSTYEVPIVLYWNAPMLLLTISLLIHLCLLISGTLSNLANWLIPAVYGLPFTLYATLLVSYDDRSLYNPEVNGGESPLHPLILVLAISFVGGYILSSVLILTVGWRRSHNPRQRKVLQLLLLSLLTMFGWFVLVTVLLQNGITTSPESMALYFSGCLLWVLALRIIVNKYDFLPDYRQLFHTLFESGPNAIILLDKLGTVKQMNPRAALLFGSGDEAADPAGALCFDDGTTLREHMQDRKSGTRPQADGELHVGMPGSGRTEFLFHADVLPGVDEELLVLHLTDVTRLKEAERRLAESEQRYRQLAHHDTLTGLYNRMAINEQADGLMKRRRRFALVLIDLDNFKWVNDTFGHVAGDQFLVHISSCLRSASGPNDMLGRLGGDEFVILIPDPVRAEELLGDISARLGPLGQQPFQIGQERIPVSYSAGVSEFPSDGLSLTELLRSADEAMYRVKRNGKNGISVYAS